MKMTLPINENKRGADKEMGVRLDLILENKSVSAEVKDSLRKLIDHLAEEASFDVAQYMPEVFPVMLNVLETEHQRTVHASIQSVIDLIPAKVRKEIERDLSEVMPSPNAIAADPSAPKPDDHFHAETFAGELIDDLLSNFVDEDIEDDMMTVFAELQQLSEKSAVDVQDVLQHIIRKIFGYSTAGEVALRDHIESLLTERRSSDDEHCLKAVA